MALDYLRQQGLLLIEKNFYCRFGEIDLIMQDQDCLCFVEVKYRKSKAFGGAIYSLTASKQTRIIKTAHYYLGRNNSLADRPLRFDAVLIQREQNQSNTINWVQNAFNTD